MATKKTATKKTTTARKAANSKATAKSTVRSSKLPVGVVCERRPECHRVTGKYTFFYVLFACTTLLFAGLSVWLFNFSSELLAKYESIETCARNHTTCEVRYREADTTEE